MNDEELKLNCELGIVKHTNSTQFYWMKLDAVKLLLYDERAKAKADVLNEVTEKIINLSIIGNAGLEVPARYYKEKVLDLLKSLSDTKENTA